MACLARVLVLGWLFGCAGCAFTSSPSPSTQLPSQFPSRLPSTQPSLVAAADLVLPQAELINEDDLLNVDIRPFAPIRLTMQELIDEVDAAIPFAYTQSTSLRGLRQAESHFLGRELANKLQGSGQWGLVRLNPYGLSSADLEVTGTIMQSDGQVLRISVEARDSRGKLWLTRRYRQILSEPETRSGLGAPVFPFTDLFDLIASDLASARARSLRGDEVGALRHYSALKFANSLAPSVYDSYLEENGVLRLPAHNDPVFLRVQQMRARNDAFLDAMQLNYGVYVDQIAGDYLNFLDRSLQITGQLNSYFQPKDPESANMNKGQLKNTYAVMLRDYNQPLAEAVAPLTLEFSDRTAELSGTLEEQFMQWQKILLEMYELDTGITPE